MTICSMCSTNTFKTKKYLYEHASIDLANEQNKTKNLFANDVI